MLEIDQHYAVMVTMDIDSMHSNWTQREEPGLEAHQQLHEPESQRMDPSEALIMTMLNVTPGTWRELHTYWLSKRVSCGCILNGIVVKDR